MHRPTRAMIFLMTLLVGALAACTTVPEQIQGDFPNISPARVEPGVFGREVRWGGVILNSETRGDATCFEILSRELDKYLRPLQEDYTGGRYIACKKGFQDPMVFGKGREVTTTGSIRNIEVRPVEGFDYRYPVLDVDSLVLWEKRRRVVVYRGYHDPFYYRYPWGYPYWGWGYHRPWPGMTGGYAETRTLLPDPSIVDADGQDKSEP
jgi:outer membrane lipoprotein